ncbi:MAG: DUF362 domain-containing protein [Armatimonadetes bacterium]|nr:DUF362 domain-containing protein [Armatimonadota bacterium]
MSEEPMDRREFLRRVGGAGAALAAATALGLKLHDSRAGDRYFRDLATAESQTLRRFRVEPPAGAKTLGIAHGSDVEAMVRAAVGALGGMNAYIKPGDIVVLKPNVAFDRGPALGATTSPEVLGAVAKLVREAGARRILVADNPINQPEGCFHKTGIQAAAAAAGCELFMPSPDRFSEIAVGRFRTDQGALEGSRGLALDNWQFFYEPFRYATKVIGIAPCKDHNLCGASMTMKNWYGLLGGRRNQFHQQIHNIVSDFPLMMHPTMVILDATRILMRHGPTGGSLSDLKPGNTVVAGLDMVSVDSYGYTLFERRQPPPDYLAMAQERGLGSTDWQGSGPAELTV